MADNAHRAIQIDDAGLLAQVCGPQDRNLRLIATQTGAEISSRGDQIFLRGETHQTALAEQAVRAVCELQRGGIKLSTADIHRAVQLLKQDRRADIVGIFHETVFVAGRRGAIHPKGPGQKTYVEAMRTHDIVFGVGPAGTGKTYLAMATAVALLEAKRVQRIVLTRPAVEAGEKLGFLPGDLAEKVNPYLRPLYDALSDMMPPERVQSLLHDGVIEVAPLAFMRGRTLNDAFVILDEAQNTTAEQMKMFLTRLGFNARAVVTGDVTQIDLARHTISGLVQVRRILGAVEGIAFVDLTQVDVVRHPLVQAVVDAYDRWDAARDAGNGEIGAGPSEK